MKKNITQFCIAVATLSLMFTKAYAAHMYISAPETASANRSDFSVTVYLDPERDELSGFSADLSFPSELFELKSITTHNSVVPLWITSPHVSDIKNLDRVSHVTFEGIFPGGFRGVSSLEKDHIYPGILFTAVLVPKESGEAVLSLSDIELRAYDSNATLIPSQKNEVKVSIPRLSKNSAFTTNKDMKIVSNSGLSAKLATSTLIQNGNPYVYVYDENPSHTIDHIEVAETDEYNPAYVSSYEWRTADNPYVISNSSRTEYVHVKVVYTNNTFAYTTVKPVENSHSLFSQSRILVYILIAILLLYHYGKNFLQLLSKSRTKSS